MTEPEINEVISFGRRWKDGRNYRCVVAKHKNNCRGCGLKKENCNSVVCMKEQRKDGQDVIFEEVREK